MWPRNFKGGIRSLFEPCVNAMGRRPYWPSHMEVSYCTIGFGAIIWCDLRILSLSRDSLRNKCMRDLSPCRKGNSCLTKLKLTSIRDGKMAATTDSPSFKFPWMWHNFAWKQIQSSVIDLCSTCLIIFKMARVYLQMYYNSCWPLSTKNDKACMKHLHSKNFSWLVMDHECLVSSTLLLVHDEVGLEVHWRYPLHGSSIQSTIRVSPKLLHSYP